MAGTLDRNTIPTRILIISDTHTAPLSSKDDDSCRQPFKDPLPAADVLIHCGDLTMVGGLDEYRRTLDMLRQIDADVKIVIAGNHDRTLDPVWMEENPHRLNMSLEQRRAECHEARAFWMDARGAARLAGVTFLEEGVHTVPLKNGADLTVYASPYTPDFFSWGFAYDLDQDRFNPLSSTLSDAKNIAQNPIPGFAEQKVDVLVTHGPPYSRLDETFRKDHVGCPHLLRALMRCRPLVHCFGHIHEGWGAERIVWSESAADAAAETMSTHGLKLALSGSDGDPAAGKGVQEVTAIPSDRGAAERDRCVTVDLTERSGKSLRRGRETLLVNAAIMDIQYKPRNAPWLLSLDLPLSST